MKIVKRIGKERQTFIPLKLVFFVKKGQKIRKFKG